MSHRQWLDSLKFDDRGLIPAIVQDANSLEVLMVAYMNREAVEKTLSTGLMHYFSRSRGRLWKKGESSGHVQRVREIRFDCDSDAILFLIDQKVAACHTGTRSCFFRRYDPEKGEVLTIQTPLFDPDKVYKT